MNVSLPTPAERLVTLLAAEIHEGAVVATGVASPLPILAIELARRTHAPNLTYLACVGSMNPRIERLHGSTEDLAYLEGRTMEVSIADLFDHARRGRVDTIFFGAAEVDGCGRTNLSAAGSLEAPTVKFPGVAGACSLRRWAKKPVLVVPRQGRRNLVERVQVASTQDARPTRMVTDLGVFELSPEGACLTALHDDVPLAVVRERTGFSFTVRRELELPSPISAAMLEALRAIDPLNLRDALVGGYSNLTPGKSVRP